jgi:hypothetical protein
MRKNASIVASLLTRPHDPSPLLRYPSVNSCCLATNEARRCDAMRGDSSRLGSARHGENTSSSTVVCSRERVSMLQLLHGVNTPHYIYIYIYRERERERDRWVGGWMGGWKVGRMGKWVGDWLDGWVYGWVGVWICEWMDGWVDGWMDGSISRNQMVHIVTTGIWRFNWPHKSNIRVYVLNNGQNFTKYVRIIHSLLLTQFFRIFCHFLSLWFKYFSQHHVLKPSPFIFAYGARTQECFQVDDLKKLVVCRIFNINERVINECGAVGGMRIGMGDRSSRRKPAQCRFVHPKSQMTCLGIECRTLHWETHE